MGQFKCELSGDCVGREKVCDGVADCLDKTDESRCNDGADGTEVIPDCGMDHFICDDGICYHQDRLCDGTQDCQDGSDEKMCHHCTGRRMSRSCRSSRTAATRPVSWSSGYIST